MGNQYLDTWVMGGGGESDSPTVVVKIKVIQFLGSRTASFLVSIHQSLTFLTTFLYKNPNSRLPTLSSLLQTTLFSPRHTISLQRNVDFRHLSSKAPVRQTPKSSAHSPPQHCTNARTRFLLLALSLHSTRVGKLPRLSLDKRGSFICVQLFSFLSFLIFFDKYATFLMFFS